jgi:hypothetical protein
MLRGYKGAELADPVAGRVGLQRSFTAPPFHNQRTLTEH